MIDLGGWGVERTGAIVEGLEQGEAGAEGKDVGVFGEHHLDCS